MNANERESNPTFLFISVHSRSLVRRSLGEVGFAVKSITPASSLRFKV